MRIILICPECNYSTTRKDNMRHHIINRHKLRKVGAAIDNLQCIQTEQKNAKIRAKAPLSAPIHNTDKLKQIKKKSTTSYMYVETLPKNKKLYSWTLLHHEEIHNKTCDNITEKSCIHHITTCEEN